MDEEGGARFSLPVGEGAGSMLGLAAGDTAGGASELGYSSSAQQAVVVAYHLFRHGSVDRDLLVAELAELAGDDHQPSVLRGLSPQLRRWVEALGSDDPVLASETGLDPAVRAVPLGVWYRRDPEALVEAVLASTRVTHLDAPSAVVATAVAGAVAGSCFVQNGRDLLLGVWEIAVRARKEIEADGLLYAQLDRLDDVVSRIRQTSGLLGASLPELSEALGDDPVGQVATVLVSVAPTSTDPDRAVEEAAKLGGSPLGAIAGAILGARLGMRRWPWRFPNDSWFAAIGERLVEGRADLVDLPIPYAVEQRITHSPGPRL
ncbi:MAG: ADP-ribosylglycohydrolase family protein [Actinomycetes bacterium]|nr:ADP-ribosylglycohydrolase family protein [Acidimicrobiia bacterium]